MTENPARDLLNNRYSITAMIGEGGACKVYSALDMKDNKKVAIKRIQDKGNIDKIKRFMREYQILKNIDHPNLVKAFELFHFQNNLCMVLEYVSGKSLGDIILNNKQGMSLVGQLAIANQVARGIEVLNMGGIIHRDIKPENVMVNIQTGEVKIVDLGTAKDISITETPITKRGAIIGTFVYMSPEQTKGTISSTSDVFSLGALLYQFFSWQNESPFEAGNVYAIIKKIQHDELPPIHESVEEANPQLTEKQRDAYRQISLVLEKALKKNPEERWENAGFIADIFLDIKQELLKDVSSSPDYYKIVTSRQISPKLREYLKQIREEHGEDFL